MLREEGKRLLFRTYGLWILLLGIAVFFLFFSNELKEKYSAYNKAAEEMADAWSGAYDTDRYQLLNKEIISMRRVLSAENSLYNELLDGKISYPEYVSRSNQENEEVIKLEGINYVSNQIKYVIGNMEERQLLYDRGWIRYFSINNKLFIIIPMIIIFYILLCADSYDKVNILQFTAINGRSKLINSRSLIAVLCVCIYIGIIEIISLWICFQNYSIPHPEFSLQSLYIFGEYSGSISIAAGVLIKSYFEIVGCLMMAGIMWLLAQNCKTKFAGMVAGAVFIAACMLPENVRILGYMPNKWLDAIKVINDNRIVIDCVGPLIVLAIMYVVIRYRRSESRTLL